MYRTFSTILLILGSSLPLAAQPTTSVDQAECLPIAENGVITGSINNQPGGSEVRVYFRRLHEEVEDFYYVVGRPSGQGRFWAVLPQAEDQVLEPHRFERDQDVDPSDDWAEWWREKVTLEDRDPNDDLDRELIRERATRGRDERREWLEKLDDHSLQRWLESLENEPTEYFSAVYGPEGNRLARSEMKVVEVRDDCPVTLTERQQGEAANLTVGETADWAQGEQPFHWLCDGLATRIDPRGVLRGDEVCRACVIAWWQRTELLIPAALVPPAVVISTREEPPVSPTTP